MTNNPKTETYIRGMDAINNFYNMLYAAMRAAMREAEIFASGAYVWRGYQILTYKELAYGQYGCQIYPDNPRELLFQESYKDPKHKASEFEKKHKIVQGRYYYPFSASLDLIHTRFFDFEKDEQFSLLKSFVTGASEQARIWQRSDARKKVTGKPFLEGNKPKSSPVDIASNYEQVGEEFLQAWDLQKALFDKLKVFLKEDILKNKITKGQWVRENASIYNFDFRGLRLRFETTSTSLRWSIYFDEPDRIKFYDPNGKRNSYNLVHNGYFDLSPDEQTKQLTDFVYTNLGMTI
jgi:hypothetical protein